MHFIPTDNESYVSLSFNIGVHITENHPYLFEAAGNTFNMCHVM